jgi:hypothetical protein
MLASVRLDPGNGHEAMWLAALWAVTDEVIEWNQLRAIDDRSIIPRSSGSASFFVWQPSRSTFGPMTSHGDRPRPRDEDNTSVS